MKKDSGGEVFASIGITTGNTEHLLPTFPAICSWFDPAIKTADKSVMIFDVTGDDIALLDDGQLREVVARVCEAELERLGIPTTYVTWGGNQTDEDGGLDVRVSLPKAKGIDGFILRTQTGFQAKKSDLPPSKITGEMKPKGKLRPSIKELISAKGAYIIVSSGSSTSETALNRRRSKMREAVKGHKGSKDLALDFYDRNRLATAVRSHPGVVALVKSKIGKSTKGWRPYEKWSMPPDGATDTFLFDDESRFIVGATNDDNGMSVIAGIELVRAALRRPKATARLVGLSGVGKTRFCEALFETGIADNPLPPTLVIYTNMAETPDPTPEHLVQTLFAQKKRAILVIDNCSQDLHKRLAEAVRGTGSEISLLTVEYDISDDIEESTEVFRLENSSQDVVVKLIQARKPQVSYSDASRIADISGGNARVALAIAETVGKGDSIAKLNDKDLFERLFHQRKQPDDKLYKVAQVCSLVYSFNGEETEKPDCELATLASLSGYTIEEIHEKCAELYRRNLLQKRGPWRAVLPHAISNKLAAASLENIPKAKITRFLLQESSSRMMRSFSRRLEYLHDVAPAVEIATGMFGPGGVLADVASLNHILREVLENVYLLCPSTALAAFKRAFEHATSETIQESSWAIRPIHRLAYQAEDFEEAANLLIKFALAFNFEKGGKQSDAEKAFVSLFQARYSNTNTPLSARLNFLGHLAATGSSAHQSIALSALSSSMITRHFDPFTLSDVGARVSDYGIFPKNGPEVRQWFGEVLEFSKALAHANKDLAPKIIATIASRFRGLWANADQHEKLDLIAREQAASCFWPEGWEAVRETWKYDKSEIGSASREKLKNLFELLRPNSLINRIRSAVHDSKNLILGFDILEEDADNDIKKSMAKSQEVVTKLGEDAAADEDVLFAVLPDLMDGNSNAWTFARAVGQSTKNPERIWDVLTKEFTKSPMNRSTAVGGFLSGLRKTNLELSHKMLDDALRSSNLQARFPELQSSVELDERDAVRLTKSMSVTSIPVEQFRRLAYGKVTDAVSAAPLGNLVKSIADKSGGVDVAIDVLGMRIFSDGQEKKKEVYPELIDAGRHTLAKVKFDREDGNLSDGNYLINGVVQYCLAGEGGVDITRKLARAFFTALSSHRVSIYKYSHILEAMVVVQPEAVLDEAFKEDSRAAYRTAQYFQQMMDDKKSPFDEIPTETLINWCDKAPEHR